MNRLILTGASGFIGRAVLARRPDAEVLRLSGSDWRERLAASTFDGASILHLGARAHASRNDHDASFADAAEKATALGDAAAAAGARVLVFASSIKVHGEETHGTPFRAEDPPRPEDPYGRSKVAAESALAAVAARSRLPIVIVRPPLVYGRHARGNLATLFRWSDGPWPLPFGAVRNRRSFVALEDLVDLLMQCTLDPKPGVRVWLAAHPAPVATATLVALVRESLGRAPRLWPVPPRALEAAASAAGRGALVRRLTRSLEVDATETFRELGWQPRIGAAQAIREMAAAWRLSQDR